VGRERGHGTSRDTCSRRSPLHLHSEGLEGRMAR
jgi:hypothetical protein